MSALVYIQANLIAPKGQFNDFGKYSYRSLEDILQGLKPLLDEQDCTLVIKDSIKLVGNRVYVKAKATLTDGEGNKWTATGYAREPEARKGMDESQITGSASSYARKYALNGLFCIDDNKDADSVLNVTQAEIDSFIDMVDSKDGASIYLMQQNDMDKYISLANSAAPKGKKVKFKEEVGLLAMDAFNMAKETVNQLLTCIDNSDKFGINELIEDLTKQEKTIVWSQLNNDQQNSIKSILKD